MIRLVTFDLDDTLWPVEPVIVRAEHRMRAVLDELAPEVNQRFDAPALLKLRKEIVEAEPYLVHDLSRTRHRIIERAIELCGYEAERRASIASAAFDAFLDARHDIEYFEDALDTLDYLSRHYILGALSNGNADVARLGLDRYFKFHINAAQAGQRKPHARMFEAAMQEAGVGPEQSVHIGDHPEDDILGAHRVGMATIWVNRSGADAPPDMPAPTWQVSRLTELRRVLAA